MQQHKHRMVGWPIGGLLALGICGLAMLGVTTSKVGIPAAVIGALAALVPVGVVFATLLWVDRWEPEPPMLLLGAFLWGAGGATACALVLNDAVLGLGELLGGRNQEQVLARVVTGPIVEELAKALFVLALWFRRRQEFNGMVDAIVYSGLAAAGFAFTENILYFGRAFGEAGIGSLSGGVIAVFVLRGILAPFSHPLFSAMIGLGIGMAARAWRGSWQRIFWPILGLLSAAGVHSAWNASTLWGGEQFLNVYFLIMVPIFGATGWIVVWQRKREQRIVAAQLPALLRAGLIVRSELDLLTSLTHRRGWQRKVRRGAGKEAARAVRDYQIAVTELAFLQHRSAAGTVPSSARRARRAELIEELRSARQAASGSPDSSSALQTGKLKLDELTYTKLPRQRHGEAKTD